jgi:hypothetical protein
MPAAPQQATVAESVIGYPNNPECVTLINTIIQWVSTLGNSVGRYIG